MAPPVCPANAQEESLYFVITFFIGVIGEVVAACCSQLMEALSFSFAFVIEVIHLM